MVTLTPAHVALDKLSSGNRRFMAGDGTSVQDYSLRRANADRGQDPFAAVLSCADSRVIPELLFDQRMGDLFVVRVAGNVADPSSVASLEFAVSALSVRLIVVLGHEACGAVAAAQDSRSLGPNLDALLNRIRPSFSECGEDPLDAVRCNARHVAGQLGESSELMRQTVDLQIVSAFYWLNSGKVSWLGGLR